MIAVIGGIAAGGAVCVGFALLVYRRLRFPRVRVTTTRADVITFGLLGLGIVTGMLATLTNIGDAVHYRESVGPYFRNLMILHPEPELMTGAHVTLIFQAHVTVVWVLVAILAVQPSGPRLERARRLSAAQPDCLPRAGRASATSASATVGRRHRGKGRVPVAMKRGPELTTLSDDHHQAEAERRRRAAE